jgi:hypothetical protein
VPGVPDCAAACSVIVSICLDVEGVILGVILILGVIEGVLVIDGVTGGVPLIEGVGVTLGHTAQAPVAVAVLLPGVPLENCL